MAWQLYGAQAVTQLASAYAQSQAYKAQAKAIESKGRINAMFAEMEADDALERGEKQAKDYRKKVRKLSGSQKAALAAQGIALESDTAQELITETGEQGALNVSEIKNNAWRQAFGLKQEAFSHRARAQLDASAARYKGKQAMLSGVLQAGTSALQGYYAPGSGGAGKAKVPSGTPKTAYNYSPGAQTTMLA